MLFDSLNNNLAWQVSVQAVQEAEELFGDPTQLIEEFQQKYALGGFSLLIWFYRLGRQTFNCSLHRYRRKRESADEEYGQHEGHGLLDADGEEALREAGYTR